MTSIQTSPNDPWWVTAALLTARIVTVVVTLWWATDMARHAPSGTAWRLPWRLSWPWCLTWWLFAVALIVILGAVRVLTYEHIREQDAIGRAVRIAEITVAIHLALWSIIAFFRWAHPKPPEIKQEGGYVAPSNGKIT